MTERLSRICPSLREVCSFLYGSPAREADPARKIVGMLFAKDLGMAVPSFRGSRRGSFRAMGVACATPLLAAFALIACTDSASSPDASAPDGSSTDGGPAADATTSADGSVDANDGSTPNDAGADARDAALDASDASDGADGATALASIFVSDGTQAFGGVVRGFPGGGSIDAGQPSQFFYSVRRINVAADIGLDGAGNIYVADVETDATKNAIQIFAPDSHDQATPIRVITGPSTLLQNGVPAIRVLSDGRVYVGSPSGIIAFAAGANGDVAPVQNVTTLGNASGGGFGVGVAGDPLYFTNPLEIRKYPGNSSGPTQPSAIITGAPPIPGIVDQPFRLTVDPLGNLYDLDVGSGSILVFGPNANGTDRPSRSFTFGGTSTPGSAITLDSTGRIYLLTNPGTPRIDVYSANANGPGTAPVASITSPTFVLPTGIATTL